MKQQARKSVLSLFLVLCMLAALTSGVTAAGSGTAESPYEIGTVNELKAFRDQVNGGERTICAVLTADIDLNGEEWTPIGGGDGYATSYYGGTFDGAGHTVSGLSVHADYNFAGFFSYLKDDAHILNLSVSGTVESNKNNVGGIAGTIINGTIENCAFSGSVTNTKTSGGYAGGIAGYIGNTKNTAPTVKNCVNTAAVTAPYAGGITGYAKFANPIANCYNTGAISGSTRSGGIAGQIMNNTEIQNCYHIGTVSGDSAGGIAGWNGVAMKNCYWTTPDSGYTGGMGTTENCEKITSPDGLLEKLGSAYVADSKTVNGGYPLLSWQAGSTPAVKDPHIAISGAGVLQMTNDGTTPYLTLTVQYIDMDDTPEITWSVVSGENAVTLEIPENTQNSVLVKAAAPGTAVVAATDAAGTYYADCEIAVYPFITTVEIDGAPTAGKTANAKVFVLGGAEYDYENYPALQFGWKYLTKADYESGNTGAAFYQDIAGITTRSFSVPEQMAGDYLSFTVRYQSTEFVPSRPVRIQSAAEGVLSDDKAALAVDTDDVKAPKTLHLPQNGENGSAITWQSSEPAVIDPASGQITLPQSGKTTVTLTATLSYDGLTAQKTFTILVYSQQAAEEEAADKLLALQNAVGTLGDSYRLYPVFGTDSNVLDMVSADLAAKGAQDVAVTIESMEEVYGGAGIAQNGDITYYYQDPNTTPAVRMGSYRVTFSFARDGAVLTKEVPVILYWDADKVKDAMRGEILDKVTEDALTNEALGSVTGNLSLPKTVDGKKWAQIAWQSSDPAVIAISSENQQTADTLFDPYVGKVRRGAQDETVTLTAVCTFMLTNDVTGQEAPITLNKVFSVTVSAMDAQQAQEIKQSLADKLDAGFAAVGLRDAVTGKALTEENGSYTAYNDILYPTTRDFGVDGKYTPVTIFSSDEDVIVSPDVNNAARTTVYRPMPGEADQTATVTVRLSDGDTNLFAEKTFQIAVPALTSEEIASEKALMAKVKAAYFDGIRGENTAPGNIRYDLVPFVEVYEKENGELEWIRSTAAQAGHGIVPVPLNGWQELEAWRLFKTSNPAAIIPETLKVQFQTNAKAVTVSSALSSETLGKYGALYQSDPVGYAKYAELSELYYQEVQADVVVRGTITLMGQMPVPVTETVSASFRLQGLDGEILIQTTYTGLDETATAFDVFDKAMKENGYTYEKIGTYIRSITYPDGTKVSEMDKGPNSGFMYRVNGKLPSVSMGAYGLRNGDTVSVFFTEDFMKEDGVTFSTTSKPGGKTDSKQETKTEQTDGQKDNTDGTKPEKTHPFTDVDTHWAKDAVQFVYARGLMVGMNETTFGPEETLSRAMFVTILHRLAGEPVSKAPAAFTDVSQDSYYADAVAWTSENGVVAGLTEALFGPDEHITRQQMAAIIFRWAQRLLGVKAPETPAAFTDYADIDDYAVDAVNWCVAEGLLSGMGDGTFLPQSDVTRAQTAVIFQNLCEYFL